MELLTEGVGRITQVEEEEPDPKNGRAALLALVMRDHWGQHA